MTTPFKFFFLSMTGRATKFFSTMEGLSWQADLLARAAEEVHRPMVDVVGWEPAQRTEVTLVDRTDLGNGYTTIFPYNQILIFPAPPPMMWTVGDYDGWLKTVFVHEYAHVLGLDPVRGYSAVMRKIFGRVGVPATPFGALFWFFAAPPNALLPPWFHEGLATNLETDLTGRGRKGSTLYRMIYRCDVAEGAIPPLDRLGGDFPDWPSYATRRSSVRRFGAPPPAGIVKMSPAPSRAA